MAQAHPYPRSFLNLLLISGSQGDGDLTNDRPALARYRQELRDGKPITGPVSRYAAEILAADAYELAAGEVAANHATTIRDLRSRPAVVLGFAMSQRAPSLVQRTMTARKALFETISGNRAAAIHQRLSTADREMFKLKAIERKTPTPYHPDVMRAAVTRLQASLPQFSWR
jgi:hypothetical protein